MFPININQFILLQMAFDCLHGRPKLHFLLRHVILTMNLAVAAMLRLNKVLHLLLCYCETFPSFCVSEYVVKFSSNLVVFTRNR